MAVSSSRVAIIGAGPYGLASVAHLRQAGVETVIFGQAMTFWQTQMPSGMFLRSAWQASHIADPRHELTLDAYCRSCQTRIARPVPLADFIAYGHWFKQRVAPDLDRRRVRLIERAADGFILTLDDGERLHVQRAIIAAGISPFAYRPPEFDHLPPALATHTAEHSSFAAFNGRRVLVIGRGQSALESAALLHAAGAEVEVVARTGRLHWLQTCFAGWTSPTVIQDSAPDSSQTCPDSTSLARPQRRASVRCCALCRELASRRGP